MTSFIGKQTKTKIIIALIFTGLLSPAFLHSEDMEENLVKNSSFEDDTAGGNPEGYVLWKADDKGTCGIDDTVGYKSEKSVKMAGISQGSYSYTIDVLPGESFQVESLCKQKGKGKPAMSIYWQDANRTINWSAGTTKEIYKQFEGKWRKAAAKVQVPAAGALKLMVLLLLEAQESEDDIAWFDNVSIKKLPAEKETAAADKKPSSETPAHYKTKRIILPPVVQLEPGDFSLNHSQQEVMNTLRMYSFKYGAISQAEAEKQIEEIRNGGFNAILTEGQRFIK